MPSAAQALIQSTAAARPDPSLDLWLGRLRLSILDLSSTGHQPILSPNDRAAMIYGEIYNYPEPHVAFAVTGTRTIGPLTTQLETRKNRVIFGCGGPADSRLLRAPPPRTGDRPPQQEALLLDTLIYPRFAV